MSYYMSKPPERRTKRDLQLRKMKRLRYRINHCAKIFENEEYRKKFFKEELEKLELAAIEFGNAKHSGGMKNDDKAIAVINYCQEIKNKFL